MLYGSALTNSCVHNYFFSVLKMEIQQLILAYCGVQHVNQGTGLMIPFSYQNLTLVTGYIMKTLVTTQLLAPLHLMASPNHCHTIGVQMQKGLCYTNNFKILAMCYCVCRLIRVK